MAALDPMMRDGRVVQVEDLVDDRPKRAARDRLTEPVEIRAARLEKNPVERDVAIDRLLEVACQLDNRRGTSTLGDQRKASGQQTVPDEIDDGAQLAADLVNRVGSDVVGAAVEHNLDPELAEERF